MEQVNVNVFTKVLFFDWIDELLLCASAADMDPQNVKGIPNTTAYFIIQEEIEVTVVIAGLPYELKGSGRQSKRYYINAVNVTTEYVKRHNENIFNYLEDKSYLQPIELRDGTIELVDVEGSNTIQIDEYKFEKKAGEMSRVV